jgi:hypothetical protein
MATMTVEAGIDPRVNLEELVVVGLDTVPIVPNITIVLGMAMKACVPMALRQTLVMRKIPGESWEETDLRAGRVVVPNRPPNEVGAIDRRPATMATRDIACDPCPPWWDASGHRVLTTTARPLSFIPLLECSTKN